MSQNQNKSTLLKNQKLLHSGLLVSIGLLFCLIIVSVLLLVLKKTPSYSYTYQNGQLVEHQQLDIFKKWSGQEFYRAVGDYNGDKIEDIAMVKKGSLSTSVYYGQNSGFREETLQLENASSGLYSADLNGDGYMELVSASTDSTRFDTYYQSSDNAIFSSCGQIELNSVDQEVYFGDFAVDSFYDIVLRDSMSGVMTTYSSSTNTCFNFDYRVNNDMPVVTTSQGAQVFVGDYNGDTYQDMFIRDYQQSAPQNYVLYGANLKILAPEYNNRVEGETVTIAETVGLVPYVKSPQINIDLLNSVTVGDINGDLASDIVTYNPGSGEGRIFVAKNNQTVEYDRSEIDFKSHSELIFGKFNQSNEKARITNLNIIERPDTITGEGNIITIATKNNFLRAGAAPGDPASVRQGVLTSSGSMLSYSASQSMAGTNPRQGSRYQVADFNGDNLDDILRIEPEMNTGNVYIGGTVTKTMTKPVKLTAGSVFKLKTATPNSSVVGNLTITQPENIGHMTVYPCAEGTGGTSNINYGTGQTIAGGTIVKTDANSEICFTANATTHFIWDNVATINPTINQTPVRRFDSRTVTTQSNGSILPANTLKTINLGATASNKTVVGTLTITGPNGSGFGRVQPCTASVSTSNINFTTGQTIANSFVVKADASGNVCFISNMSTHAIVDVSSVTDSVSAINPVRNFDSRDTSTKVNSGSFATVTVSANLATGNLAVGNLTMTDIEGPVGQVGYATVWPCGTTRPLFSNLNFTAGQTVSNFVVTAVNASKQLCIYTTQKAHIIWDTQGIVTVASTVDQKRIYDSRSVEYQATLTNFSSALAMPALNLKTKYRVATGDFNGDNRREAIFYQPSNADEDFLVSYNSTNNTFSRCALPQQISGEGYYPYVGDFNGDKVDDIAWIWPDALSNVNTVWYGTLNMNFCSSNFSAVTSNFTIRKSDRLAIGDFDANGADDIFIYAPTITDRDYILKGIKGGTGLTLALASTTNINRSDYQMVVGEFTGDGRDDIIMYAANGGNTVLWAGFNQQSNGDLTAVIGPSINLGPGNTYLGFKSSTVANAPHSLFEIGDRNATNDLLLNPLWPACFNGLEPNIETGVCPSSATAGTNTNSGLPIPPQYPQRAGFVARTITTPYSGVRPDGTTGPVYKTTNTIDTAKEQEVLNFINSNAVVQRFWKSHRYATFVDVVDQSQIADVLYGNKAWGLALGFNASYTSQVFITATPNMTGECHTMLILHEMAHAEQHQSQRYTRNIPNIYAIHPGEIDAELRLTDLLGMGYSQLKDYYGSRCNNPNLPIDVGYKNPEVLKYLQDSGGGTFSLQSVTTSTSTTPIPSTFSDLAPKKQ